MQQNQNLTTHEWSRWWNMISGRMKASYNSSKQPELIVNLKLPLRSGWHKPIRSSPIVEQGNPKLGTLQSSLLKDCLSSNNAITTLLSISWTNLKLRMIPGSQTDLEDVKHPLLKTLSYKVLTQEATWILPIGREIMHYNNSINHSENGSSREPTQSTIWENFWK